MIINFYLFSWAIHFKVCPLQQNAAEMDPLFSLSLFFLYCFVFRKGKITKKDKQKRKTAREIKYADFFDPPDGEMLEKAGSDPNDFEEEDEAGEEMESEDYEENEENHQDSSDENEVEDDDDDDDDDDGDDDDEKSRVFSNFEKKQEKVGCQNHFEFSQ